MELASLFIAIKNIIVFAFVIGILIAVHEWGHFITAKWVGVKVDEFALGFGKTLVSYVRDGTKFMIKAIPLGGYVKMAGDERSTCKGEFDEFFSKTPGQRALIVLNGPVVNFIFAFVCFWVAFMLGYPGISTKIEEVIKSGPAAESGLQVGDKIVSIDGKRIYGQISLNHILKGSRPDPIIVGYERNGKLSSVSVVPEVKRDVDFLGLESDMRKLGIGFGSDSSVIGFVAKNHPAEKAGLQGGDRIIRIDNQPVEKWETVQKLINYSPSEKIKIDVIRDDKEFSFFATPTVKKIKHPDEGEKEVKIIGIAPIGLNFDIYRFNPIESIEYAWTELNFITIMTYRALYSMVVGEINAGENVAGPVGIFYIVNSAADAGMAHLLKILAIISASLALFNLLPIPILDGGHLMLLGFEKIRGKPLSDKAEERFARIGFSLIVCLAIFVFYNDFRNFGLIDGLVNLWK